MHVDSKSYNLNDLLSSHLDGDGDVITNYFRRKGKRYGLLSFLKSAQDTILPQRVKKGY